VCEGQALDKDFEIRSDITERDYLRMIELKTSAVLEFAAVAGAWCADAPKLAEVEALRQFARHAGLAFQINDDLLDLTAEAATFGKQVGGDIIEGKRTYLLVTALQMLPQLDYAHAELLQKVAKREATVEDIPAVRSVMAQSGVLEKAGAAAAAETERALAALESLPDSEAREKLRGFALALLARTM
jgi:geranylgeranyl pyrophosphate synthase